jgi:methylated-DNA-[protein]-cysteine S-methyltransferase
MPKWTAVPLAPGVALFVEAEGDALRRAQFGSDPALPPDGWPAAARADRDPLLRQAARELKDYMAGRRRVFSLPFELDGTGFQCRVWAELCKIPFGELSTYAAIAQALGNPNATRAVGAANGRNPLPIIVPCHRVIASDGSLAGYSGGIGIKRLLLHTEGVDL